KSTDIQCNGCVVGCWLGKESVVEILRKFRRHAESVAIEKAPRDWPRDWRQYDFSVPYERRVQEFQELIFADDDRVDCGVNIDGFLNAQISQLHFSSVISAQLYKIFLSCRYIQE